MLSLSTSKRVRFVGIGCVLAACFFAQVACQVDEGVSSENMPGSGGVATGGTSVGGTSSDGGSVGAGGSGGQGPASGGSASGGSASGGNVSTGGGQSTGGTGGGGTVGFSTNRAEFLLGAASTCDQGTFDVCESFEAGTPGQLPQGWTLSGYGTRTLGIVTDQAARGANSLRIDIAGSQGAVVGMMKRENLGSLASKHYGRMFYRIEGPGVSEFIHFDVLEAVGPWMTWENGVRFASTGTGVGTTTSNWSWIYNVQPGSGGGAEFGSEGDRSAHPRVDEWMCLEWSFDADAQEAQYFHDGAPIEYLHIDTERSEIPVFTSISVGLQKFQNTGALRAWVDEVALDGERIGCNF
jgi:hypothetical protein